jgi:molybdopterin-guanine dinucleotide biosynthesis protein
MPWLSPTAVESAITSRLNRLSYAVAHRRRAARHLAGGADLARPQLHLLGVAIVRLMRRQHVVVGGDDADVHRPAGADRRLVLARRREAVGEIAARHAAAIDAALALLAQQREIAIARRP